MENNETNNALVSVSDGLNASKEALNKESAEIIRSITSELDTTKTKDMTALFNLNQTKKTMVRVDKCGELLDSIVEKTIDRYKNRPDEISNQELLQGLKIVQDIVERGQKQVADSINDKPLIQVNQQTNEINLGTGSNLPKESRDRVKNAVMSILAGLQAQQSPTEDSNNDIIDIEGTTSNDKEY